MTKKSILALAVVAAGVLAPAAHADTFLQYSTTSSAESITFDGTALTGAAIPVNLSYLDPVSGEVATGTLNFSATTLPGSAGEIFPGLFVVSLDNISFSIMNGVTDILSGTATTGSLVGGDSGLSLSAQQPDSTITYTSSLYGSMTNLSFQINAGVPDTNLSVSGGTLSSFNAEVGTGAFVGTLAATPEPSSIALLGTGLAVLFLIARRRLAL